MSALFSEDLVSPYSPWYPEVVQTQPHVIALYNSPTILPGFNP